MDTTSQIVQIFGMLAILTGAALIFARGVAWIFRKQRNHVRLGLELLIFFAISYGFGAPALTFIALSTVIPSYMDVTALFWWLSLAFTIDAGLKRFVWDGALAKDAARHVPKILSDGATVMLYAGAVMIVMHFVYDEPITAVMATSGAVAFIVGFSAQTTLGEIFAGLSLNSTRALRIGDYLEINGIYGRVHDVNWRSVSLHNPHTDSLYVFPNSAVASSIVLNYNVPTDRFKNPVKFVVEYSAPPELVIRLILDELKNARYVFKDPAPDINIMGFTDLGMEYRIRYCFDGDDPWWDAQNEVCNAIWTVLRRNGIRLAIDRHKLQSGDELELSPWPAPAEPDAKDVFAHTAFLAALPKIDIAALAAKAVRRDYNPPDCIYREGAASDTVYVIVEGRCTVSHTEADGTEIEIDTLETGDAFGFIDVVSDQPRGHTVQALQYTTVFEIDAARLRKLTDANAKARRGIEAHAKARAASYTENTERFLEQQRHQEHHKHRRRLMSSLKDHISSTLGSGFLAAICGTLLPRTKERKILDAVMAACAMIASVDGGVEDKERATVTETLDTLELLKHTGHDAGLAVFDDFVSAIAADADVGSKRALDAIHGVAGDKNIGHIVVGICHGIHGASGQLNDAEHREIVRVAEALGVSSEPEHIVKAIA